jgi:hypothetical protein
VIVMKFMRAVVCAALFAFQLSSPCLAWPVHGAPQSVFANSQLTPSFLGGSTSSEFMMLNMMKEAPDWVYGDASSHALPTDLDSNGYPLNGSNGFSHNGYNLLNIRTSSQFERAGNWIAIFQGQGEVGLFSGVSSTSTSPGASGCSGTRSGTNNINCTNSTCTSFTGSISGTTLTVSVASSCNLLPYQPISNASIFVSAKYGGVPTMIIGNSTTNSSLCSPSCTGSGGTGTYAVNWSQSIASTTFVPGMYNEISAGTEITTGLGQWTVAIGATSSASQLMYGALVHKNDLLAYAQGQMVGAIFKQRVQQANFAYLRDLNTGQTNNGNITTWATRKPINYFSYLAPEQRSSLYQGQASYTLVSTTNQYTLNLGSSLPVDKQTVCFQPASSATSSGINTLSIDNGANYFSILGNHGQTVMGGTLAAGSFVGVVYDATSSTWYSTSANTCLNNYMPPEAFVEINQELGTSPYVVEPLYAADPITDYPVQEAIYLKSFSWPRAPILSVPDETWNCSGQGVANFASIKSRAYIAVDAAWAANTSGHVFCGGSGDINNWTGKVASLLGQAVRNVSQTFILTVGVQTVGNGGSGWNANVLSNSYVGQNPADLPIQSGCAGPGAVQTSCPTPFTQTAAYIAMKGATAPTAGIEIANYFGVPDQTNGNRGTEVGLAYCYFYQAGGCASQSSIMTTYMSGASVSPFWASWYTFATTCAGGSSCTAMSVYNYEGGYDIGSQASDVTQSVTSATNASVTVLAVANNGCVAGQTVGLTSVTGGTWSASYSGLVVQAAGTDANHCAVNINSTGLGTLSGGTLTYTGSANYVSYLRVYSWVSPQLATDNTSIYNEVAGTFGDCSPNACSLFPSQFNLSDDITGGAANCCWLATAQDPYGYVPVAKTSAATAASGSLTLGTIVTGIFTSGLTLLGGGVSGATITSACTQTGSLPAGGNPGDVCPISNSSTVSSTSFVGAVAPTISCNSPVTSWQSIGSWNHGSAC